MHTCLVDMLSVNLNTPAEISFYCYGVSYNDFLTWIMLQFACYKCIGCRLDNPF